MVLYHNYCIVFHPNALWFEKSFNFKYNIMKLFYSLLFALFSTLPLYAQNTEYTDGVFFVNEDWYGHQNGSVNFLNSDGTWEYNIFREVNDGRELGCTTQFGTIYGDKFFLVSKQEQDPGSAVLGSRFAVCDAKTMVILQEFPYIATDMSGKSIADGRSFLGVNEHKGYIGTSNGIWVFDIDKLEIGDQIAGTENPNESGYGQLYHAQIGSMVRTDDYVFALHQENGILVIDPETDQLIRTIAAPTYIDSGETKSRGFGAIVQSKDGNLWISMAQTTDGMGAALPYFLRLNPHTLETEEIEIPTTDNIELIPNSWYAWTADAFCASVKENKIYWGGNNNNSWFVGYRIFCYDIDKKEFSKVYDFDLMPGNWRLYGTGFRIHPVTDELYCSLYHDSQDPTYQTVKISNTGELLAEYPMITNYWFPAMPVFPDLELPIVNNIPAITCSYGEVYTLSLKDFVTDADNIDAAIIKTVLSNSATELFEAKILNGILNITPLQNKKSSGTIVIQFNSNGKLASKNVEINIEAEDTSIGDLSNQNGSVYVKNNTLFVDNYNGYCISIYNVNGQKYKDIEVTSNKFESQLNLPQGIYILKVTNGKDSKTIKIILK